MNIPVRTHQAVVIGAILLAGFADQPRVIQFGGVSALAALMVIECAAVWCCWLKDPWSPARHAGMLSFVLFGMWAVVSLLWTPMALLDIQPPLVFLLFLGLVLLSVREVHREPAFASQVGRAMDVLCVTTTVLCIIRIIFVDNSDVENATSDRSLVIVMLVGIAHQLSEWQCGRPRRLLFAGVMLLTIIFSLSRMASVVGLMLFPLAVLLGVRRSQVTVKTAQVLVVGGMLVASVLLYEPMYDRFFGSNSISEVSADDFDSSGRTEMWEEITDSFRRNIWFGQGSGSTRPYTDKPGLFHPHNDYLLLAHDYGLVGLGLWMLGIGATATQLFRHVRRAAGSRVARSEEYSLSLAALLSLVVLVLSMGTDNTVTYTFVMAPIAILIGSAAALAGQRRRVRRHLSTPLGAHLEEGGALCRTSW